MALGSMDTLMFVLPNNEHGILFHLFFIFFSYPHQSSSFQCLAQSLSCVRLFVTPWTAARQAFLSITNTQSLLKLMYIVLVMQSNHLILCYPLLLLPSIFPKIRGFSNESVFASGGQNIGVSASATFLPKNTQDFRMDCLDLPAVQGTLKSLLQHHSSKAFIL